MSNLDKRIADLPSSIYDIISRIDELKRRLGNEQLKTAPQSQSQELQRVGSATNGSTQMKIPPSTKKETVHADNG